MKKRSHRKAGILVVDDHTLFREGLKMLLIDNPDFEVLAEAGSVGEACRKAGEVKPLIVLMDIGLPDTSGIEGARLIREQDPSAKVVIISMYSKMEFVIQALQAGAVGFIVKDSTPDMLLCALGTVARGCYYFDPTVTEEIVQFLLERHSEGAAISETSYDKLTQREQEVMRLVAQGASTKEIAARLCISPKTVENHRTRLMDKLGFDSLIDLVKYAARLGIINLRQ